MAATVDSWPDMQCTCTLLRMSHSLQVLSRPPVMSSGSSGCTAMANTPDRWAVVVSDDLYENGKCQWGISEL